MRTAGEMRAARMCAREERRAVCMFCSRQPGQSVESEREGRRRRGGESHVEGFKVFADLCNELFATLIALWEAGVWLVGLGKSEET